MKLDGSSVKILESFKDEIDVLYMYTGGLSTMETYFELTMVIKLTIIIIFATLDCRC